MKASKLIDRLQHLIDENGDLEVAYLDNEFYFAYGFSNVEVREWNAMRSYQTYDDDECLGERYILFS